MQGKQKNPDAVVLGRLGGLKGGKVRSENMTVEQRSWAARRVANARWRRPDDFERYQRSVYDVTALAPETDDPDYNLKRTRQRDIVLSAVRELPRREYLVIVWYVYKEMTLEEIGKRLFLTRERVRQIKERALRRLNLRLCRFSGTQPKVAKEGLYYKAYNQSPHPCEAPK